MGKEKQRSKQIDNESPYSKYSKISTYLNSSKELILAANGLYEQLDEKQCFSVSKEVVSNKHEYAP